MTKFDDFLADQLKDPEFKKEWDALDPEFSAVEFPNAETLAAIQEVQRMKQDPSLGKTYANIDLMIQEALL